MKTVLPKCCMRLSLAHATNTRLFIGLAGQITVEHRLMLRSLCGDITYVEGLAVSGRLPRCRLRSGTVAIQALLSLVPATPPAIEYVLSLEAEIGVAAYVRKTCATLKRGATRQDNVKINTPI